MIIDLTNKSDCISRSVGIILDKDDLKNIEKYYYLYEYSDDITVITDNPQYPNMFNYVKTGILTEEEMLQALLYR